MNYGTLTKTRAFSYYSVPSVVVYSALALIAVGLLIGVSFTWLEMRGCFVPVWLLGDVCAPNAARFAALQGLNIWKQCTFACIVFTAAMPVWNFILRRVGLGS